MLRKGHIGIIFSANTLQYVKRQLLVERKFNNIPIG